jgi:hypothetical protein
MIDDFLESFTPINGYNLKIFITFFDYYKIYGILY